MPPSSDNELIEWQVMFNEELRVLSNRDLRKRDPTTGIDYLTGLCLSGGGVRSASVSLGVLQAFSTAGILKHFDYLSTVSGGGYIGAALALRYAQEIDRRAEPTEVSRGESGLAGNAEAASVPTGLWASEKADLRPSPDELFAYTKDSPEVEHIRHHASYLAPRGLGSLATGFFIVARSIFFNLFIWITIGAALLALLMYTFRDVDRVCVAGEVQPSWCATGTLFDWLIRIAVGIGVLLLASTVGVSLSSWWVRSHKPGERSATRFCGCRQRSHSPPPLRWRSRSISRGGGPMSGPTYGRRYSS